MFFVVVYIRCLKFSICGFGSVALGILGGWLVGRSLPPSLPPFHFFLLWQSQCDPHWPTHARLAFNFILFTSHKCVALRLVSSNSSLFMYFILFELFPLWSTEAHNRELSQVFCNPVVKSQSYTVCCWAVGFFLLPFPSGEMRSLFRGLWRMGNAFSMLDKLCWSLFVFLRQQFFISRDCLDYRLLAHLFLSEPPKDSW